MSSTLQEKRDFLLLQREADRRAEKDVYSMVESEIDTEVNWRMASRDSSNSAALLQTITDVLERLENRLESGILKKQVTSKICKKKQKRGLSKSNRRVKNDKSAKNGEADDLHNFADLM